MMKLRYAWFVLLLIAPLSAAADQTVLHIGRDVAPSVETDIAVAVLNKAYSKIGVEVRFVPYPLRRSLQLANSGEIDGDAMRFEQAFADTPNLIRLSVPVLQIRPSVYLRSNCPGKLSWAELRGRRVAYELGVNLLEARLVESIAVYSHSNEDSFRLLQRGMADVVVALDLESDIALRTLDPRAICKVEQPLEIVPLYHALHQRHVELAQKLEKALQEMEASGEIRSIWATQRARLMSASSP